MSELIEKLLTTEVFTEEEVKEYKELIAQNQELLKQIYENGGK